ncbi:Mur ligase family protein [Actinoplanes sp. NBRC 103695]|uniref:Mur ligase domain-containing protein n=1 Tax=Actinoplanes sp. NBRC 103695 TaxID=3032202 RepID=UPI0024A2C8D0|nr:Mur ligase family protein [Actinoplanes sp. NBRC 103695]GLY99829.1 UDP-N-acetylmuramate--L-alanine ligase [Actinoplanes sp. NBRC 103695]
MIHPWGKVHVVGVAGIGASSVARLMLLQGIPVSGSDLITSRRTQDLVQLGLQMHAGHNAALVAAADTIVVSPRVPADNVEVLAARACGRPVMSLGAALAVLAEPFRCIAVSGSHGKTTIASMLIRALRALGQDPSFSIGGYPIGVDTNAHIGDQTLIVETNEADASFLHFRPDITVVTNVRPEPLPRYPAPDDLFAAFEQHAGHIRPGGTLVAGPDEPARRRLTPPPAARLLRYGTEPCDDVQVTSVRRHREDTSFVLRHRHAEHPVSLPAIGVHTAENAAAAFAAGLALDIPATPMAAALGHYAGVHRRLETISKTTRVRIVDDYAIHPTAVEASITAARTLPADRLIAVYVPLRINLVHAYAERLAEHLARADHVLVIDAPDATPADATATGRMLAGVPAAHRWQAPDGRQAAQLLARLATTGDLVLLMGDDRAHLIAVDLRNLLEQPSTDPEAARPRRAQHAPHPAAAATGSRT